MISASTVIISLWRHPPPASWLVSSRKFCNAVGPPGSTHTDVQCSVTAALWQCVLVSFWTAQITQWALMCLMWWLQLDPQVLGNNGEWKAFQSPSSSSSSSFAPTCKTFLFVCTEWCSTCRLGEVMSKIKVNLHAVPSPGELGLFGAVFAEDVKMFACAPPPNPRWRDVANVWEWRTR